MSRQAPRILMPGELESRRSFIKKGLLGAALLAAGGGVWLGTRRTHPEPALKGPFQVLTDAEATVILAIADRLVPPRRGFPRPLDVGVPGKVDAIAAMAHPAVQREIRQLIGLFESPLTGAFLDGLPGTFTGASPEAQDRRLHDWATSRLAVRRTGFRALKKLVYAAYYASPQTYPAVGYPGPPIRAGGR
ncbi:gluconate 2-dehydrogenase subunit 3 family protein [Anaeromyxobacter paludicola]|uniref:Gluconate 2-dehydrogenase subunit 3 family protein n=1 Tax=Anaeromyxobacter paludicola TaxID=2918171 RepID=A0ABN6NAS5_9BACT|nr:gluconate 2-dehydrogenase subunit 3 family protein [Anaeromyxobacter paludicola]BDG10324.1 hypothetical protein AMPC_34370 [Anaeromyxobacter paludicola]